MKKRRMAAGRIWRVMAWLFGVSAGAAVWLAVVGLLLMPAIAAAGGCYHAPTYRPAYVQPTYYAPQTYHQQTYAAPVYTPPPYVAPPPTVINNIVAVPVPVPYLQPIAKQGDTVFGYSSLASVFPTYDPAAVLASSERLAVAGNDLARDGIAAYQAIHAGEVDAKERVATILATSQAFREITSEVAKIQAQKLRSQSQSFANGLSGGGGTGTQSVQSSRAATSADQVLQSRCASCHEAYKVWGNLTADKQDEILERLTTDDETARMPRLADKKTAAKSIPLGDLSLLMDARKNRTAK